MISKFFRRILRENMTGTWEKPTVNMPKDVLQETASLAVEDSAQYIMTNMLNAISFHSDLDLLSFAFAKAQNDNSLILEFGVFKGASINHLSKMTKDEIFGFDSFEGLYEDWGGNWITAGHFSLNGVEPIVASNVKLIKGWFHQTLPLFLNQTKEKSIGFLHIDSDTYEACKTILESLRSRIITGSVLVFNEYHGYRGWRQGEFKAFQEFCIKNDVRYRYIGFSKEAVALIIE